MSWRGRLTLAAEIGSDVNRRKLAETESILLSSLSVHPSWRPEGEVREGTAEFGLVPALVPFLLPRENMPGNDK